MEPLFGTHEPMHAFRAMTTSFNHKRYVSSSWTDVAKSERQRAQANRVFIKELQWTLRKTSKLAHNSFENDHQRVMNKGSAVILALIFFKQNKSSFKWE